MICLFLFLFHLKYATTTTITETTAASIAHISSSWLSLFFSLSLLSVFDRRRRLLRFCVFQAEVKRKRIEEFLCDGIVVIKNSLSFHFSRFRLLHIQIARIYGEEI
jgi:hypothetical protein